MKILSSGYYTDGYNLEQIRCWGLTRACACGCFNKEYYYMYCFLYAMHRGWFWKYRDSTEDILKQLGLRQQSYEIISETDLLGKIHAAIDNDNPIMLILQYDTVYFNSLYKENTDMQHCLLITGYDAEKGLLNLKDYLFAREFVKATIPRNVEVFIDFKIKEEYLLEMWRESKEKGVNNLFVLEQEGESQLTSDRELLQYFVQNVHIREDNYSRYNFMEKVNYNDVRKRLYNSIYMMLDIVKRALNKEEYCICSDIRKDFENELNTISKNRNVYTNMVIKDLMKCGSVQLKTMEYLIQNDWDIVGLLERIYKEMERASLRKEENLDNLALNAKVLFDSQGENALAVYAVDGKVDDRCWLSDHRYEEHWLIVDLESEKAVNRFVIKHHPHKKNLVTCDFRIEGSNDLQDWNLLAVVQNNDRHESIIDVDMVSYRFFRLYIERANIIDENAARIYGFEIYCKNNKRRVEINKDMT